jgi:hypothetical protein
MYDYVKRRPQTLRAIIDDMTRLPGVRRIYTSEEMEKGVGSSDPQLRAAALSHVPGRSGDLAISLKAGWMFYASGTTHGTATPDDQRVPVLFYGRGIKPGRYDGGASPADVAPTLARVAGVALPKTEGRALEEALR